MKSIPASTSANMSASASNNRAAIFPSVPLRNCSAARSSASVRAEMVAATPSTCSSVNLPLKNARNEYSPGPARRTFLLARAMSVTIISTRCGFPGTSNSNESSPVYEFGPGMTMISAGNSPNAKNNVVQNIPRPRVCCPRSILLKM